MTDRIPDPGSEFEDEGIPDLGEDGLPGKRITGDAQEGMAPPGEHPTYGTSYGVTAEEQREGMGIDEYLREEEPESTRDRRGEPAEPEYADEEPVDSDVPYPEDPDERGGRLVEEDEGVREDTESDMVARDVGTDAGGFSPEERAIHIRPAEEAEDEE